MTRTETVAQRTERRRADRELAVAAVEALRSSEGWQRWLNTRRQFRRYSLANQLLIALQSPDATHVAGFRAWLKLGYCVRRGERGLRIWAPIPPSKRDIERWRQAGADRSHEPRVRFKLVAVFDRSQVEPLPPPSVPAPLDPPHKPIDGDDAAWALPRLTQLGAQIGSRVEFAPLKSSVGGYYERETKRIVIAESGSINAKVATLVHELAHALVRAEPGDDDTQLTYGEEELVVESVAFSVCGAVGLDTAGSSIPYLASWAQTAELSTLERTAALIDRLARRIEDVLLEPIPAD